MEIPDKWIVIRIKGVINDESIISEKVLAGWYGGYTGSDSWKLNSGIKDIEETNEYYDFKGYSGSVYRCYKHAYGTSGLTNDKLVQFQEKLNVTVLEEYNKR